MNSKLEALTVMDLIGTICENQSEPDHKLAIEQLCNLGLLGPLGSALAHRTVRYVNDELQRMLAE